MGVFCNQFQKAYFKSFQTAISVNQISRVDHICQKRRYEDSSGKGHCNQKQQCFNLDKIFESIHFKDSCTSWNWAIKIFVTRNFMIFLMIMSVILLSTLAVRLFLINLPVPIPDEEKKFLKVEFLFSHFFVVP